VTALTWALIALAAAHMRHASKADLDALTYTVAFWAAVIIAVAHIH
jgi:hypothetical protein